METVMELHTQHIKPGKYYYINGCKIPRESELTKNIIKGTLIITTAQYTIAISRIGLGCHQLSFNYNSLI